MINKLPFTEIHTGCKDTVELVEFRPVAPYEMQHKINELADAVNTIQKEREAERFEIQEWIGILEAVRKSVNVHEKQIDELQMKAEPEKCKPAENGKFAKNAQDETPRCPFCNGELVGTIGHPICRNQNCVMCDDPMPQDLLEELIRTRKALEVAKEGLNKYTDASGNWRYGYEFQGHYEDYAGEYADKALEQITALEQKDVK